VLGTLTRLQNVTVLLYNADNSFSGRLDAPIARLEPGFWQARRRGATPPRASPRKRSGLSNCRPVHRRQVQESFARPETMSFWPCPGFIDLLQQAGFSAIRHRLYLQSLLAGPLLLSAMILIAATFSLRPARRAASAA